MVSITSGTTELFTPPRYFTTSGYDTVRVMSNHMLDNGLRHLIKERVHVAFFPDAVRAYIVQQLLRNSYDDPIGATEYDCGLFESKVAELTDKFRKAIRPHPKSGHGVDCTVAIKNRALSVTVYVHGERVSVTIPVRAICSPYTEPTAPCCIKRGALTLVAQQVFERAMRRIFPNVNSSEDF